MTSMIVEGALATGKQFFATLHFLFLAVMHVLTPIFKAIYIRFWKIVNAFVHWHKLPKWLGVFNLLALRYELQEKNLYDTYPNAEFQGTKKECPMKDSKFISARHSDGYFNDLGAPKMGCAGMRFGRNVPRKHTKPPSEKELLTPNPRVVSEKILARPDGEFKPATIVNLLAAAWIQFQVHDWAQHFFDTNKETYVDIPLGHGDQWSDERMDIPRSKRAKPLSDQDYETPAYENECTHWWDASQIYGSTEEETQALRATCDVSTPGQLSVTSKKGEQFLPREADGIPATGFRQNWWLGLELLHTLFALEHNAIAKQLHMTNPTWSSDKIFDTARLINCALMAKIHTVEWTPGILQHPALQVGMDANWWGLLGEKLWHVFGRAFDNKSTVISGIPGAGVNHDGAPYCLTEEFVSVYRLHPLIPDNIAFFNVKNGKHEGTLPIKDVAFESARKPMDPKADFKGGLGLNIADAFYSFGVNYPGAIRAHNMPNFLRDLQIPGDKDFPEGRHIDMGTIDILRDRERGVPRYNAFRRLFHMPPARSFVDLTGGDVKLAAELSDVYQGDLEKVDLLVGTLSEPLPEGFGFSDTAFRVFILMATRRIQSDRFLAGDGWCPEIYTREGINWVQNNTMKDVLCRHFPELAAPLRNVDNAFAPWEKIGQTADYKGVETNTPKKLAAMRAQSRIY
ncbi:alpha-dioxygenase 1 [Colletotrichum spaethianum]|uniref:Alpha-dioxygenase 1 n=1 Tax=Colletotrichum spaethianum TaxID=700344 RepID=A0AA37LLJ7_9PEZI|nr:alpha-dioxygenase 1 [Colletotrichum spaethianum]GKT46812.1 alpha-dioxygenase 1 [Colletotrichum spaethianum]